MGILVWIIVGAIAGFVASKVLTGKGMGLLWGRCEPPYQAAATELGQPLLEFGLLFDNHVQGFEGLLP